MKSNSKKREGSTLIEIVISMAIIGILSVGVYNSYMIMIKTTKVSEKKQIVALIGKKIIEEIRGNSNSGNVQYSDTRIKFGDNLELNGSSYNYSGIKKLDAQGNYYDEDDYKYEAEITLTKNDLSLSKEANIGYLYNITVNIKDEANNDLFNEKCNQTIKVK